MSVAVAEPNAAVSSEGADPLVGRTLAAKYRIDAFVGGGAMGKVYRGTQVLLDRTVAVKVLHAAFGTDEKFVVRFQREAKAASRIDHPNSLQVIDFGVDTDGVAYIVMEFLDGQDLHKTIYADWPFTLARIVDIMTQTLSALAFAHDAGIVHRDLKPENIVLVKRPNREGERVETVKVADFGIAKMVDSGPQGEGARLTTQGMVAGTPEYMSPEQAHGRDVDGRADLYACGVILFQMVTGKLPFDAESAIGIVLKHLSEPPPPPRSITPSCPAALEAIILKALEKEPERRFANAREMSVALRAVLQDGEGAEAAISGPVPRVVVARKRAGADVPTEAEMAAAPLSAARTMPATPTPETPVVSPASGAPLAKPRTSPAVPITAAALVVATMSGFVIWRSSSQAVPATRLMASASASATVAANPLTSRVAHPAPTPSSTPVRSESEAVVGTPFAPPEAQSTVRVENETARFSATEKTPPRATNGGRSRVRDSVSAHATSESTQAADIAPAQQVPTAPATRPGPSAATGTNGPTNPATATAPATQTSHPAPAAAAAPVTATSQAATPAVAPLRDVRADVVRVAVTNGLTSVDVASRTRPAADDLARCVLRHARGTHDGESTPAIHAHIVVDVRDRGLDSIHVRGDSPLVNGCENDVQSRFGGLLPEAEDSEYTITEDLSLVPVR